MQVLEAAAREAETMKDEFVSTEHLLLALTKIDCQGAATAAAQRHPRSGHAAAPCRPIRGSARVTDQNPEDKFQALERYGIDLVERASQGKLDPVIGRDRKSAA